MPQPQRSFGNTSRLGTLLERIEAGDSAAREELLAEGQERLRRMASKILGQFPALRQQGRAETGMVLNDVLLNLYESFDDVQFQSPQHFINLAAQKIRFRLLDLARKHRAEVNLRQEFVDGDAQVESGAQGADAVSQDDWSAFHIAVENLPEEEKQVFTLRYYGHWSREESALILGVAEKTVTRRYSKAKESLADVLRD